LTKNKGKNMNEQIFDLAEQAGFFTFGDGVYVKDTTGSIHPVNELIENFSKLLLEKCVDICVNGNATQMTSNGAAQSIKLRFEIE